MAAETSIPPAIYIAGPMTGLPDFNYPRFAEVAAHLRAQGCTVFSPHEVEPEGDISGTLPWEWYMKKSLALLTQCDTIYMLHGWHKSRGAGIEHALARILRMSIIYEDGTPLASMDSQDLGILDL